MRARARQFWSAQTILPARKPDGALAKMEIKEMSEATQRSGQHLHIANVSNEDEINTAMAGGDAHRCRSQCWITRRRGGPN